MIKKRSSKKIPAHYGMSDYYKYFCNKYPDLLIDKQTFNNVITEYNKVVSESIIKDLQYKLPYRLGTLEMLKEQRDLYINDKGKVVNTNPVDWKSTLNLWDNNENAKENKVLIRFNNNHTGGFVFRIFYNKKEAIFKNKKIYFFKPVRELKRSITKRIRDYSKDKYDTYIKK